MKDLEKCVLVVGKNVKKDGWPACNRSNDVQNEPWIWEDLFRGKKMQNDLNCENAVRKGLQMERNCIWDIHMKWITVSFIKSKWIIFEANPDKVNDDDDSDESCKGIWRYVHVDVFNVFRWFKNGKYVAHWGL